MLDERHQVRVLFHILLEEFAAREEAHLAAEATDTIQFQRSYPEKKNTGKMQCFDVSFPVVVRGTEIVADIDVLGVGLYPLERPENEDEKGDRDDQQEDHSPAKSREVNGLVWRKPRNEREPRQDGRPEKGDKDLEEERGIGRKALHTDADGRWTKDISRSGRSLGRGCASVRGTAANNQLTEAAGGQRYFARQQRPIFGYR